MYKLTLDWDFFKFNFKRVCNQQMAKSCYLNYFLGYFN